MIGPRLTDEQKKYAKSVLDVDEFLLLQEADDPSTEITREQRRWLLRIVCRLCESVIELWEIEAEFKE